MTVSSAPAFDEVLEAVRDVEGWLTPGQARLLWDRVTELGAGARAVEIGSFRGRSLIVLARGAAEGVELVAIDPHAGNDRGPQEIDGYGAQAAEDHVVFWDNLRRAGVAGRIRHLRMFSHAALTEVDGAIDLLYVDGAHRFAPARDDIRRWGARVAPGGTLLVHDAFSSLGVTAALAVTLLGGRQFRYLGRVGSLVHYRRERLAGRARAANAARQAAQLPWFVRNLLVKTLITVRLAPLTRVLGHDPRVWPH